ncbi:MAG: DNA repair protein RecO [Bacteroides sp.]|nr:DNA repair protein RecO [Bacteroides sp.]MCM1084721.1 DNA repair protein RecO [Bacteroides sp.]
MNLSTEGIVVRQTRYGDNALVVNIYTRSEGMQSFMVRGGQKAGGRFRASCFFPLSQVEIGYSRGKQNAGMPFLREVRLAHPYREMYSDIRKSSVAFFLAEVMARFITQSEQDPFFYDRLARSLREFDGRQENIAEFHLFFLLELASNLGFCPRMEGGSRYFDLREGCFCDFPPVHREFLEAEAARGLARLLQERNAQGEFPSVVLFPSTLRFALLQALTRYCQLQSGIEGTFKSLAVLKEVFS